MPSMARQWESGHWIICPGDGRMVVIGVASRHEWRSHEIAAAKNDAAQKIAMFYGVAINFEFFQRIGTGFFNFVLNSRTILTHLIDYTQFIDRLTFDPEQDVLVHDLGTLVRFRYAAHVTPVNFVGTTGLDGRPSWINSRNLPEIEGYEVAVGFSMRQEWLRDTVMRSAADAAARIMRTMTSNVNTLIEDVVGIDTIAHIHSTSNGVLGNFRVLEFWIDPMYGHVHTLGIARR
ncbi:MAG: hypothetical protein FWB78_06650 [Treponema sp.]|nr:hypothetical protein [Treponema sp.]